MSRPRAHPKLVCCRNCEIAVAAIAFGVVEAVVAVSLAVVASVKLYHVHFPEYDKVYNYVRYYGATPTPCYSLEPNISFTWCHHYDYKDSLVDSSYYVALVIAGLIIPSFIALVVGVKRFDFGWLVPHMIVQILMITASAGFIAGYIHNYIDIHLVIHQRSFDFMSFSYTLWYLELYSIILIYQIFYLAIVLRCCFYLNSIKTMSQSQ